MTLQDVHCRLMQLNSCESHNTQSVRNLLSISRCVKQTSRQVFPPLSPGRLPLGFHEELQCSETSILQRRNDPEIMTKKNLILQMRSCCQVMAKYHFCSKNSIAWCWFQVMERHLLLWNVTRAGRECLVTFQPRAKVAYSHSKRSLGCLFLVEKCWWHKGYQKSAGSNTRVSE